MLLEALSSDYLGNLFLLVASVVGVAGSYLIYRKKRSDRRNKLRLNLLVELKQMREFLDEIETDQPAIEVTETSVYESNLDDLGLLSEDEAQKVVSTYSTANLVNEMKDFIVNYDASQGTKLFKRFGFENNTDKFKAQYEDMIKDLKQEIDETVTKLESAKS